MIIIILVIIKLSQIKIIILNKLCNLGEYFDTDINYCAEETKSPVEYLKVMQIKIINV